jgi:hypothetical protein
VRFAKFRSGRTWQEAKLSFERFFNEKNNEVDRNAFICWKIYHLVFPRFKQGFQIFLDTRYCNKWPQNLPNWRKINQMAIQYSKCSKTLSKFSIQRSSTMHQNWFENKPIGNPVTRWAFWKDRTKCRDSAPRDEFCPLGVKLSPPGVKILCLPLCSSREKSVFTPGGKVHPLVKTSPQGANWCC